MVARQPPQVQVEEDDYDADKDAQAAPPTSAAAAQPPLVIAASAVQKVQAATPSAAEVRTLLAFSHVVELPLLSVNMQHC